MQAMSLHKHKKETQGLQIIKIESKAIDMRLIFHIDDILNDS